MKKYLMFFTFQLITTISIAQKHFFDQFGNLKILSEQDKFEKKKSQKRDYIESNGVYNDLKYNIIPSRNNTWGYDIYSNKKLIIHQPIIPGIQILHGFKTKNQAEKAALIVINKMKNGEFPPTISIQEINALKEAP
jgi:hypothetical protein